MSNKETAARRKLLDDLKKYREEVGWKRKRYTLALPYSRPLQTDKPWETDHA